LETEHAEVDVSGRVPGARVNRRRERRPGAFAPTESGAGRSEQVLGAAVLWIGSNDPLRGARGVFDPAASEQRRRLVVLSVRPAGEAGSQRADQRIQTLEVTCIRQN